MKKSYGLACMLSFALLVLDIVTFRPGHIADWALAALASAGVIAFGYFAFRGPKVTVREVGRLEE